MGNVRDLRERYQLTRQQFSDLFCIPIRTVQSWELGERSCPAWVFRMLDELLMFYVWTGKLESFRKGDAT